MTEQEIIAKVRTIMNEAGEETMLTLLSEDTVKLTEYIKSAIPDAVSIVMANSPVRCVNKKVGNVMATSGGSGTGYVLLPEDFVSLIAFKMPGWKRMVAVLHPVDSEEYKVQCNEFTRSGISKPMCFLNYNKTGQKVLEYFATGTSGTTVDTFVYGGRYSSTEGIDLSGNDPLASAVCYMCASLVYSIFENEKTAKEMQTISLNLIPKV